MQRKAGRPPFDPGHKMDRVIHVRIDEKTHRQIEQAAGRLSVGEWIRIAIRRELRR